jgi:hypothetical protein
MKNLLWLLIPISIFAFSNVETQQLMGNEQPVSNLSITSSLFACQTLGLISPYTIDSLISVYPRNSIMGPTSTVTQRTVTVKIRGPNKCTSFTTVWFGSIPLNLGISYTDSTVTDTLFKYPTMPNGTYRVFLTDHTWPDSISDTLLSASRLLNPSITVTNP